METPFARRLVQWNADENRREMPWKGEKDPYKIWLSEVILQQTRVEQGLGYYNRFVKQYPTIRRLAAAKDDEVYKLWEGLGYYSRCRNLLLTVRQIVAERKGVFPDTYRELLQLKGVGPYIAAAIASFAYNLPHAVLDGNVFRVLSRVYALDIPIDSTEGKKAFSKLALENLDQVQPGVYNQAIMDFGATICKPLLPACMTCPMRTICQAFRKGMVNQLPVKEKVLAKKVRWHYYFVFRHEGRFLVHQRTKKDIWHQLYEFYLFEAPDQIDWNEARIKEWMREQLGIKTFVVRAVSALHSQQLTHQTIRGQLMIIDIKVIPKALRDFTWVDTKQMSRLAMPKFVNVLFKSVREKASW